MIETWSEFFLIIIATALFALVLLAASWLASIATPTGVFLVLMGFVVGLLTGRYSR